MPARELKHRLSKHLQYLVGARDPYLSSGRYALTRQYISTLFREWGQMIEHPFEIRGQKHVNFVLKVAPHQEDARKWSPILVGAHYDTVPGTPGADDNASGLAVLLELARHVVKRPPQRPIWFVAFDMEEYGLLGSQAYAAELRSVGQPLRLMLSLEMLGYCDRTPHSQRYPSPLLRPFYPNTGDFVALIGNLAAIPDLIWLKRCLQQGGAQGQWLPVPQRGKLIPAVRRSDHAPFWDQGYRAVMVTDTAFLRNPHYHKASDTLTTLDLTFMTQACLGLMQALEGLT